MHTETVNAPPAPRRTRVSLCRNGAANLNSQLSTLNPAFSAPPNFFTVRLWTQKELLEQLFAHYDHLDEDLKAELPLKRIWTVAAQEEE
jgi:hypothetical protein